MIVKCSRCGKFCKSYDFGVRFCGSCLRSPNPDYFCEKCVNEIKAHPENYYLLDEWYIQPRFIYEIEKKQRSR